MAKNRNIFQVFMKPICEAKIAPYLCAADLYALTQVSSHTRDIFKDQIKLHKDAHIIVNEVLNGTPESVRAALEKARIEYGDDVGMLLLTPTRGVENHSGRKWKHETAIRLAANAGDLYQWIYELRPALQDGEKLRAGNIHVAMEKLDQTKEILLSYTVLTPTGERVTDYITEEELHGGLRNPLNIDELKKHLPAIMAITFKRGHTANQNRAHPEYAGTYLLNVLFEFITDQYRQPAIAQLQHLRQHGTEHGAIVSAFNELNASYTDYVDHYKERDCVKRDECWQKVIGGKQRVLPKFGLQLLFEPIAWQPMPNFNNLPAPRRDPMLNDGTALFPVLPSRLGSSGAIYTKHWRDGGGQLRADLKYNSHTNVACRVLLRVCEMILVQLDVFIAEQIRLDVEYKLQKQNSRSNRR